MLVSATEFSRAAGPSDNANFDAVIAPFFRIYCVRCHGESKQDGEFRLDNLSRDFTNQGIAQRWSEVVFRLNAGEMPPKKERQPKADELGQVVDWINTRISEGEAARMARRGPISHNRLSRDEYGHTIYDLLGVHFDVNLPGAFNEEPRWHGFDRIGSLLSLSPSHVERYFKAAEIVVSRAFPDKPVPSQTVRKAADDGKTTDENEAGPIRWLLWPGRSQQAIHTKAPGLYRVRIQASGVPSFKGRLPHLGLWSTTLKRMIIGADVNAAEDKPSIIEFETFLPEGHFNVINESPGTFSDQHTLSNTRLVFRSTKSTQERVPTGYKFFDDHGQPICPLLIVDWVETQGPIVLESDEKKRSGVLPTSKGDLAEARQGLKTLATRAWRRPVSDDQLERYVKVLESELAAGDNFANAFRSAMVGILTSKNFYYLEEGSAHEKREKLNDWELASRLSYFLWSSMPDDQLFAAAQAGTLSRAEILRDQMARMTVDPKIARFNNAFPRQWLQLHRLGQFPADTELYPDYDKWLEESMVLETTNYFDVMFRENRSIREFLVSNWTMLNPRLVLHYGLSPLSETGFQKVVLRPEDNRGGLLTQASVLSLTSDGTRHRPVHRGVWVSEAIFGRTPPPPPPNVEPLAPTPSNQPKATIRQQLEAHATHTICASCHQKIDPLGLAFDNFDAIGRWRTEEKVQGGQGANPPVNPSGTLADGRIYANANEFKQLLAQDLDRFAEAFIEQLATFALRRVMTLDDAPHIKKIAQSSKQDDYRLRKVLENFVLSDLFQKR